MNITNNIKRFLSYLTDDRIFINRGIDIHNDSSIITNQKKNTLTAKYKLRQNLGSFELYGTIRDSSNVLKYVLLDKENNTKIHVTEKLFKLIFERE